MTKKVLFLISLIIILALLLISCGGQNEEPDTGMEFKTEELSEDEKLCVECHATETVGIVASWDSSKHADSAVSCLDCHFVEDDSPLALKNVEGHEDLTASVSMLVPPAVCAECHEDAAAQFYASGHYRAALQVEDKESMQTLIFVHEGQELEGLDGASGQTGCDQCHGVRFVLDENGIPTADTYPSSGMGNIYPDGDVGNCSVCHTRHNFDIAEARKPEACASCHIGPDHPDLEIYEASKHGQLYASEGEEWIWDRPPGEWEPGDYTAPTCATCHMSGIGELNTTHNVTERLYWNAWAKVSKERNDPDVMAMYYGDGDAGRELMVQVCTECHSTPLVNGFFESADNAVKLYNEAYFAPAEAMRAELAELGLLKDNPWKDEFQVIYYYLWHHEGRRARQGSLMGGADWAHWHGFFDLMQDIYKLEDIYEQRIETGEIE